MELQLSADAAVFLSLAENFFFYPHAHPAHWLHPRGSIALVTGLVAPLSEKKSDWPIGTVSSPPLAYVNVLY